MSTIKLYMGGAPSSISLPLLFYSFLPFMVQLYLLHIEPSPVLFCVVACHPKFEVVSVLFWKYLEYPQAQKQL